MSGTPELLDVTETPGTEKQQQHARDILLQKKKPNILIQTRGALLLVPFPGPLAADLACACEEELYPLL